MSAAELKKAAKRGSRSSINLDSDDDNDHINHTTPAKKPKLGKKITVHDYCQLTGVLESDILNGEVKPKGYRLIDPYDESEQDLEHDFQEPYLIPKATSSSSPMQGFRATMLEKLDDNNKVSTS